MIRTILSVAAVACLGTWTGTARGQADANSVESAFEVSQTTGRPIFALAGSKT